MLIAETPIKAANFDRKLEIEGYSVASSPPGEFVAVVVFVTTDTIRIRFNAK